MIDESPFYASLTFREFFYTQLICIDVRITSTGVGVSYWGMWLLVSVARPFKSKV